MDTSKDNMRIGDRLIADGVITTDQLNQALALQKELRENEGVQDERSLIGFVMVKMGFISENLLVKYIFGREL